MVFPRRLEGPPSPAAAFFRLERPTFAPVARRRPWWYKPLPCHDLRHTRPRVRRNNKQKGRSRLFPPRSAEAVFMEVPISVHI